MCKPARSRGELETIFGATSKLFSERPRDDQFAPAELRPKSSNYVISEQDGECAWDVMTWDVLAARRRGR